jgi:Tol biopolymer transport system component
VVASGSKAAKSPPKSPEPMRLRALIAVVVASLAAAGPASATIVFEKSPFRPTVWAAADDGSARVQLADGELPRISPDGTTVAYETPYRGTTRPTLRVIPAAGGASRRLLNPVWYSFGFSPDSKTIAAVTGKEVGQKRLVLIDVASGRVRTVAHGQFSGFSFSPDSATLVFSRALKDTYPPRSDLLAVPVAGGLPTVLTTDHRSIDPVWGAPGIAFVKLRKPTRRGDAFKQDIYLLDPATKLVRRITTTKVPFLLSGLDPVSWSADGTRLLAEFGGQDTSYAETVDPATGIVRRVGRRADGLVGYDLSADGTTILATTGGYDPGDPHDVVTIPYTGGTPTVLVKNAFSPDWTR